MCNNFKKYLPSKKFLTIVLFIAVVLILFFTIKLFVRFFKDKKLNSNQPVKITVGGLIQKDSNDNDIPDWEEYLWGLDPNKNGQENKNIILSKKKELAIKSGGDTNMEIDADGLSQSESLSRQFFALVVTLQQSGSLDENVIQSISETAGEQISAKPIADKYTKEMLKTTKTTTESLVKYKKTLASLFAKYKERDMGEELTFIAQGIKNSDQTALYAAKTVAMSYEEFAEKLIEVETPTSVIDNHLGLANNYYKTGKSIDGMASLLVDPILGMKSIINYKKYSDALVLNIESL
jgi:hypothetical protein